MSIPVIPFKNNEQIAHALAQYLKGLFPPVRHLTLRVRNWNTRNPDARKFSDWWLIPSTEWPAHNQSKLLLRRSVSNPTLMFAGLHITKGFGRQLPGIVKADMMMSPQWYWHSFINDVWAGMFDTPMQTIRQRAANPVHIRLNLYELNHVPDFSASPSPPNDYITFITHETDLNFKQDILSQGILTPLNGTVNLQDLVGRILALQKATFYWIEIQMGIYVRYGTGDTRAWGVSDLWHNALEPWLKQVR